MNVPEILQAYCWSVICESYSNGDDASIGWVVVGYFQAKPFQRVIGMSDECGGVEGAIEDALNTVKNDNYAYQHEYKPK